MPRNALRPELAEAREQGVPEGQKVTGKRFEEEDK